jgi:hypothetical protein
VSTRNCTCGVATPDSNMTCPCEMAEHAEALERLRAAAPKMANALGRMLEEFLFCTESKGRAEAVDAAYEALKEAGFEVPGIGIRPAEQTKVE